MLAFSCRTSEVQERISDIKGKMVVFWSSTTNISCLQICSWTCCPTSRSTPCWTCLFKTLWNIPFKILSMFNCHVQQPSEYLV